MMKPHRALKHNIVQKAVLIAFPADIYVLALSAALWSFQTLFDLFDNFVAEQVNEFSIAQIVRCANIAFQGKLSAEALTSGLCVYVSFSYNCSPERIFASKRSSSFPESPLPLPCRRLRTASSSVPERCTPVNICFSNDFVANGATFRHISNSTKA